MSNYASFVGLFVAAILIGSFWSLVEPNSPPRARLASIYAGTDACEITGVGLAIYSETVPLNGHIYVYPYHGSYVDDRGQLWLPPKSQIETRDRTDELSRLDHCLGPLVDRARNLSFLTEERVQDFISTDSILVNAAYPPARACLIFHSVSIANRSRHATLQLQDVCGLTDGRIEVLHFQYERNRWRPLGT